MNCQEFHEMLLEYVEGSLSRLERAEVEAHLATCDACAEAVRTEKQIEVRLSAGFRESVERLTLGEQGREKLLQGLALSGQPAQPAWSRRLAQRWIEFTAAFGAAAAVLAVLVWFGTHRHAQPRPVPMAAGPVPTQMPETASTIQIRLPYVVRSYTFQQNGDFVVDTLVEETNLVNVTLAAR